MFRVALRLRNRSSTMSKSGVKRSSKLVRSTSSTRAIIALAGGRRSTPAFFVTRIKSNTRLRTTNSRYVRKSKGDGFRIISDADVVFASKGDSKLPIPLRRERYTVRLANVGRYPLSLRQRSLRRRATKPEQPAAAWSEAFGSGAAAAAP